MYVTVISTHATAIITFQGSANCLSLVVRASPTHPPLALLCAAKQLKSNSKNSVTIGCHVHSSLGNTIVPKNLISDFTSECDVSTNTGSNLKLTVVWKNGEENHMFFEMLCLTDAEHPCS